MGGIYTVRKLLEINPSVHVIVTNGYSSDPVMRNYKDYGFCATISKPFTKAQLAEVLRNALSEITNYHQRENSSL